MGSSSQHDLFRPVWGVDVGRTGLRAVRLEGGAEKGRVHLQGACTVQRKRIPLDGNAEPALGLLGPFVERFVKADDRLWVGLPAGLGIQRRFETASDRPRDLESAVAAQVESSIPFDAEHIVVSHGVLGDAPPFRAHAFAARQEHVQPYETAAGRPIGGLQLAHVALFNAVIADRNLAVKARQRTGGSAAWIALVAMGMEATSIVCTDGLDFWSRVIPVGGRHMTTAVAEGRECSPEEAEAIKCGHQPVPPFAFVPLLKDVYLDFAAELNQTFGTFQSSIDNKGISRVICVGDGFATLGLLKFLEQQLRRDVVRLDEWHRIVPGDLENHPDVRDHADRYAVAYGLALQGLGLGTLTPNFAIEGVRSGGWGRLLSWFGQR